MSWPIVPNISTNYVGKAGSFPTLIVFGTDSIYSGVIVRNITSTPIIEEITEDNGSGIVVTQFLLYQGDEMNITVTDDRAISWPDTGGVVALYNPQPNGTGGTLETFQVINNNYSVSRKTTGERTLIVKRYNLVVPVQM